jgi:hypothetical protein
LDFDSCHCLLSELDCEHFPTRRGAVAILHHPAQMAAITRDACASAHHVVQKRLQKAELVVFNSAHQDKPNIFVRRVHISA